MGLVDFSLEEAVEQVEIFFVKKKQDKLRMILDCRRSNCHFGVPSNVKLATGDSLARVEVGEGEKLYICNADLANAFYTLSMPAELRKFFGLRRIRARDLGITEVCGQPVGGETWVTPRVSVLPMGWSWALYWCQSVHEKIVERAGLKPEERLQDFSPAPKDGFFHIQYVDNLHVGGTCKEEVLERFRRAVAELEATGLTVHEIEECDSETRVLGWEYDSRGFFRPGRGRVWRARKAIREIVRRGRASGQQLERLVGHMTFISLGRREVLSVFAEVYTFIRKHYAVETPLWKSVRRELQTWDGICPLIVQNLRTPWSEKTLSVDASEWGLGVCETETSSTCNRQLGSFSERWRFRDPQSSHARSFAFIEDEKLRGAIEVDRPIEDEDVSAVGLFSSVPYNIVDRSWLVVGRYKWKKQESMPVLEARSTLHAVKHILRSSLRHRQKHVILTDSMTAALAFSKGRAKTQLLRNVVQRVSALCLASGSTVFLRWIPSEWNPSDSPSRGGFDASVLTRVPEDAVPGPQSSDPCSREAGHNQEEVGGAQHLSTQWCQAPQKRSPKQPGDSHQEEKIRQPKREDDRADSHRGKLPTGIFSGDSHSGELPAALARIHNVVQEEEAQHHQGGGVGQSSGPVSGRGLRCRRRVGHWQLCEGQCPFPPSRVEGSVGSSKDSAGFEGVAQTEPSQEPDANTLRSGGFDGGGGQEEQQGGDRIGPTPELHAVSQAWGVCQDQGVRCGETGPKGRTSISALGNRPSPSGGGNSVKDCSMGRSTHPRFALSEFPGKSNRCSYEIEEQATNRNGVQGDSTGGQPIHATTVAKASFRDSQCAAPVSPATRRSILRTGGQTQAHHRSADQRKMGNRSVSQKLRKGVEAQPAVRQSAGSKATRMHPGNRAIGSSFPRPALQVQRPIKTSVFLEIFSGSGRLGQSVFQSHHSPVLLWDIDFGENYDLTRLQNQQKILEWMRCGYVRSGHLGTPCNSFSRARDQPGGPPPLRSDDRPLGLANLKVHDALKVKVGNQLMRFTARVLKIALELIIPFTLENPARSRLWICPPILAIRRRRHVVHQLVEYCSFGEAWRKSTLFLGIHIDLCPLEPHRCIGSKRGLCKFSGKPHIPLAGRDSSGQWRTKTAEPYPRGLCKVLAVCFGNAEVRRIADSFSRFLQPTEIPVG